MIGESTCAIELRLAGVAFRVTYPAAERAIVESRYGSRGCAPASNAVALTVEVDGSRALLQPLELAYPGARATWQGDGRVVLERRDERLQYDLAARTATLTLSHLARQDPAAPVPSFEAALRMLLSIELNARGGLLLHAAGWGDDTQAVVFPAFSGGGKTTTAHKIPPEAVLSDDQVALRRIDGVWHACSLPFVGLYARPTALREVPLRAIALLEKASEPALRRLRPAEATSRLLGCVVQFLPGAAARRAFEQTAELVSEVPAFALSMTKDAPLAPWLEKILNDAP